MTSSLKQLINLPCNKVEFGQSPGILELYFDDFKFLIECSWLFQNGSKVINNADTNSKNLPSLKDSKIINISTVDDSNVNINISFDDDSMLEIRQDDLKYEAWQLYKNDKLVIVAGPGNILNEF